jgi:hypothetical protein
MSMIGSTLVCDHNGDATVSAIVDNNHVAKDETDQKDRFKENRFMAVCSSQ